MGHQGSDCVDTTHHGRHRRSIGMGVVDALPVRVARPVGERRHVAMVREDFRAGREVVAVAVAGAVIIYSN